MHVTAGNYCCAWDRFHLQSLCWETEIALLGIDGEIFLSLSNRAGEGKNTCARKKKELAGKCQFYSTACDCLQTFF